MQLHQITMDREAAQRAYEEYREAVRAAAEQEAVEHETRASRRRAEMEANDEAIMAGYRQLAKGKPIIDLRTAIVAGGQDAAGRPRIAIIRADDAEIRVNTWRSGRVRFEPNWRWGRGERPARAASRVFDFLGLFPPTDKQVDDAIAKAPYIPPGFRPVGSLDRYHLLWEATWQRAPRDPALLRHLGGGLYLVVATWDLTDLEASVLGAI